MSAFRFHENGITGDGRTIYDVRTDDGHAWLGLVHNSRKGWVCYVNGDEESGYPTRKAAAERLLIVRLAAIGQRVVTAALPADPFDGVSA
ncbi:hypothetical protein EHM76_07060 [bacterium]|nr:MAG: hypothetical protein EHM76_07060 [bacterium]